MFDIHSCIVAKRAVTRTCPICNEEIPIRLLGAHLDLETSRVDEIIQSIGSTEVLGEAEPDDGCEYWRMMLFVDMLKHQKQSG